MSEFRVSHEDRGITIFCLMEVRAMVVAWLYNSPQRNASLALPRALSNTAHLPVQRQHTKPAQLNSGTDSETVFAT